MATILRADGTAETVQPKNGTDFRFVGEAYNLIGADCIQIVSTHDGRLMLIDEEGKLRDKPVNEAASALYEFGFFDPVVGDVLVCEEAEVQ